MVMLITCHMFSIFKACCVPVVTLCILRNHSFQQMNTVYNALCSVGVTSEPECTVKELTPVDKFMILASDGVWEFIESQDAVDIVGNCETVEEGCRQVNTPHICNPH